MTVAELIEKLQQLPQDLPVWRGDNENGAPIPLTTVQATETVNYEDSSFGWVKIVEVD